ncbi:MAG: hypothetical protein ACK559_38180, partial [bacterium]
RPLTAHPSRQHQSRHPENRLGILAATRPMHHLQTPLPPQPLQPHHPSLAIHPRAPKAPVGRSGGRLGRRRLGCSMTSILSR